MFEENWVMRSRRRTRARGKSRARVTSGQKVSLWPHAAAAVGGPDAPSGPAGIALRPAPGEGYALQVFEALVLESPRILQSKPPLPHVKLGPTERQRSTYQSPIFGESLAAQGC